MNPLRLAAFLLFEHFSNWLVFISVLTFAGYELGAGPTEVALVTVSMLAPQAVFGRWYRQAARHWDCRTVLLTVTGSQILLSLLLVGAQSVWSLCVILLIRSFVQGLFQPAFAAIASEHQSNTLASQISLIQSLSRIVAPALGGLVSSLFGEPWVFAASAILAAMALPFAFGLPTRVHQNITEGSSTPPPVPKDSIPWLLLVCPMLFVNGMSNMFSNLIPYAFHFYELPKPLLALAISCSAGGGILANLLLMKRPPKTDTYPQSAIWLAWFLNSSLFLAMALVLPVSVWAVWSIPLLFFCLSGSRALFEVAMNGYIFNQERDRAITLASQKQSLMAITGIGATFVGASAMEFISPSLSMAVSSILALLMSCVWLYGRALSRREASSNISPQGRETI